MCPWQAVLRRLFGQECPLGSLCLKSPLFLLFFFSPPVLEIGDGLGKSSQRGYKPFEIKGDPWKRMGRMGRIWTVSRAAFIVVQRFVRCDLNDIVGWSTHLKALYLVLKGAVRGLPWYRKKKKGGGCHYRKVSMASLLHGINLSVKKKKRKFRVRWLAGRRASW